MTQPHAVNGDAEMTMDAFTELAREVRQWGRWGEEDEVGTLNHVDGGTILAGRDQIKTGQVLPLAIDFGQSGPQTTGQGGRFNPVHWMLQSGTAVAEQGESQGYADDVVQMCVHGATHWDGLGHGFFDGAMWNGYDMKLVSTRGALRNAVTAVKDRCLGRGVLADVATWAGADALAPGHQIHAEDLEACLDAQGVSLQPGDFLLVRTGQIGHAARHGWGQYAGGHAPGLTLDTAKWLRDASVAAVATDTWGAEVRPNEFTQVIQPWHRLVISNVGLTVGEMFNLEELAQECAHDRRYTFFLTAPTLPIVGGTGSPVNPLAIR